MALKSAIAAGDIVPHIMPFATHTEPECNNHSYKIIHYLSPLVSIGMGKICHSNNKLEDAVKDGITYVLYNNMWGTTFPFWYENNAYFEFEMGVDREE